MQFLLQQGYLRAHQSIFKLKLLGASVVLHSLSYKALEGIAEFVARTARAGAAGVPADVLALARGRVASVAARRGVGGVTERRGRGVNRLVCVMGVWGW